MEPTPGRTPDSEEADPEHGSRAPRPATGDSMRGSPMWSRRRTHRRHRHDDDEGRFTYHPPGA